MTRSRSARASFFDASALAKVFIDEPSSDIVRNYFNTESTKYTTPFCYYETLNVLKNAWLNKNKLSINQYLLAAENLSAWFRTSSRQIKDIDFTELSIFAEAKALVERTSLDLSDVFQILSVKYGYFSPLCNESSTVLVTADKKLSEAARELELRVWFVLEETPP